MKRVGILLCLAACCMFLAHGVLAQGQPTGNIGGTVADPDNKAVAGATVTSPTRYTCVIPSTQTGLLASSAFSNLPPGNYTVTVSMANFKTTVLNNIVVTVDHTYEVPVKMEVGAASVSVQVEGGGQQVMETKALRSPNGKRPFRSGIALRLTQRRSSGYSGSGRADFRRPAQQHV